MLPLKRSPQYERRARNYAMKIAERYGAQVAESFIQAVEAQENLIARHNHIGVNVPYVFAGRQVILKEVYFDSGPVSYCLVYEVLDDCIPLISLWHAVGVGVMLDLFGYGNKAIHRKSRHQIEGVARHCRA